jgi:hypothetical protein
VAHGPEILVTASHGSLVVRSRASEQSNFRSPGIGIDRNQDPDPAPALGSRQLARSSPANSASRARYAARFAGSRARA